MMTDMRFFERVIEALNQADVSYVVVGGLAVVLHGHARLTVDLDLVVDLEPTEARKAVDTLLGLGLEPAQPVDAHGFADAATRDRWVADKDMQVLSLRDPSDVIRRVDLFVRSPIVFGALDTRAVTMKLGSTDVRVAAIPDLIAMKREAGRPVDLADIEELEAILQEQEDA